MHCNAVYFVNKQIGALCPALAYIYKTLFFLIAKMCHLFDGQKVEHK